MGAVAADGAWLTMMGVVLTSWTVLSCVQLFFHRYLIDAVTTGSVSGAAWCVTPAISWPAMNGWTTAASISSKDLARAPRIPIDTMPRACKYCTTEWSTPASAASFWSSGLTGVMAHHSVRQGQLSECFWAPDAGRASLDIEWQTRSLAVRENWLVRHPPPSSAGGAGYV